MQKTMSEVRKVAEAIGWSAETLQRAWEAAGIAIVADPPSVPPWRAAYADWIKGREHDVLREEDVWKAAVDWCVLWIRDGTDERLATESKAYLALDKARRRIMGGA